MPPRELRWNKFNTKATGVDYVESDGETGCRAAIYSTDLHSLFKGLSLSANDQQTVNELFEAEAPGPGVPLLWER